MLEEQRRLEEEARKREEEEEKRREEERKRLAEVICDLEFLFFVTFSDILQLNCG